MPTKTPAKKQTRPASPGDAIALLTNDHKEVHALFQTYSELCKSGADSEERQIGRASCRERVCLAV